MSESICFIPHSVLMALFLLFVASATVQTIFFGFKVLQRSPGKYYFDLVVEASFVFVFLILSALCWDLSKGYPGFYLGLLFDWINITPLSAFIAVVSALSLARAILRKQFRFALDGLACLFALPVIFNAENPWWCAIFVVSSLYFTGRTAYAMMGAWTQRHEHLSYFAAIEGMYKLPEGLMCFAKNGEIILLNDAMRACLAEFSLSTDLSNALVIVKRIREMDNGAPAVQTPATKSAPAAQKAPTTQNAPAAQKAPTTQTSATSQSAPVSNIRAVSPSGNAYLFTFDVIKLGKKPCYLMMALDINEEELLSQETQKVTRELAKQQEQLRESLQHTQEVANNDALLYMQSRVHDIIGQRLSILHRYLEDDSTSEELFAKIRPLLNSILDDLENVEEVDSVTELYSVVYAFSLINVKITISGKLPQDTRCSHAFVQVIREACTNAVKHAQAALINVVMQETASFALLTITNNGEPFTGVLLQGTGLPGMARAIVSLGGEFDVQPENGFAILAKVPLPIPSPSSSLSATPTAAKVAPATLSTAPEKGLA